MLCWCCDVLVLRCADADTDGDAGVDAGAGAVSGSGLGGDKGMVTKGNASAWRG